MSARPGSSECLVIGGGLAGSMLAMRLAAQGREVTLLEKERTAHQKVCGEFLSAEAVAYLRAAGIEPLALGAKIIRVVRLAVKKRLVDAALPFTAMSLSRCALDEALLARAGDAGCKILRGALVGSLTRSNETWTAQIRNGEAWQARTAFLATGKHDLSGVERNRPTSGEMVGFKLHWRLTSGQTDELREAMELFLFTGGYGGLSLVENGAANLSLVVRRAVLRSKGGWTPLLDAILNENVHLAARLGGATALWDRPLAIYPIPYGHLAAGQDGLWRVGDQATVIPSFTGDGMSIALHSGALAAEMFLAGKGAIEFHWRLNRQLRKGMQISSLISRAMLSRLGSAATPFALALAPGAMGSIAEWTRIPAQAMAASAAN